MSDLVSGFIDYIVSPTLTVLGDCLDLILTTLDIPSNAKSVPEENCHGTSGNQNNTVLHRPWQDILTDNREKWQKKHDAGKIKNYLTIGKSIRDHTTSSTMKLAVRWSHNESQKNIMKAQPVFENNQNDSQTQKSLGS